MRRVVPVLVVLLGCAPSRVPVGLLRDAGISSTVDAGSGPDAGAAQIRFERLQDTGDLALSDGAGSIIPGGGEPNRGEADWYAPGVVLSDLTGDGRPDIFLPRYDNTRPEMRGNRLYRNNGDGTFSDVTTGSGLGSDANSTCGVAADVDNDGDEDLFVGNDLAPSHLYLNDGAGHFTDVAAERGITAAWRVFTAAMVDYDHDGRLDAYLGTWDDAGPLGHHGGATSHISPNHLLHQEADGTFVDVTAQAGGDCHGRSTLAAAFGDVNGDGWEDLYVANDFFDDCFYVNNGDGTFTDVTTAWNAGPDAMTGMGVAFGDIDNDGDLDIYVADDRLSDRSVGSVLYWNMGGHFESVAAQAGVDGRFSWGTVFADFNQDGRVDLFAATMPPHNPHLVFQNVGLLDFIDVGPAQMPMDVDARGVALGDVDGDGRLDLVVANRRAPVDVFLNRTEGGHGVLIRPVGSRSNRSGVGAWVTLWAGGQRQVRTVVAGDSYRSSSPLVAHFGVGAATTVERVEVRFAGGAVVTRENLEVDTEHVIVEP
ncbi:MAG: CRTAC1 family protein [Myxococcota bacterium]